MTFRSPWKGTKKKNPKNGYVVDAILLSAIRDLFLTKIPWINQKLNINTVLIYGEEKEVLS